MNKMTDASAFRDAMARLGAAVNIVTTDGPAGRHGLTVSAVCSVSDSPPTLLVCVNRTARSNPILKENGVLCVNVLQGHHEYLAGRFAGRSRADASEAGRFASEDGWQTLETGSPVLADAAAAFDCRISGMNEVGSHSVIFCEVEAVSLNETPGSLIYFNRTFYPLPMSA